MNHRNSVNFNFFLLSSLEKIQVFQFKLFLDVCSVLPLPLNQGFFLENPGGRHLIFMKPSGEQHFYHAAHFRRLGNIPFGYMSVI